MIRAEIESFLRQTGMAWTRFGRLAAGDPRFVGDLRRGREPRPATVLRIKTFIDAYKDEAQ